MNQYIKKDKVLSLLGLDHNDYVYIDKRELAKKIEKLKGIDAVSVVHGEWLDEHEDGHGYWVGTCSRCGKEKRMDNFCPNCGADMRKERE